MSSEKSSFKCVLLHCRYFGVEDTYFRPPLLFRVIWGRKLKIYKHNILCLLKSSIQRAISWQYGKPTPVCSSCLLLAAVGFTVEKLENPTARFFPRLWLFAGLGNLGWQVEKDDKVFCFFSSLSFALHLKTCQRLVGKCFSCERENIEELYL